MSKRNLFSAFAFVLAIVVLVVLGTLFPAASAEGATYHVTTLAQPSFANGTHGLVEGTDQMAHPVWDRLFRVQGTANLDNGILRPDACRTYYAWGPFEHGDDADALSCGTTTVAVRVVRKQSAESAPVSTNTNTTTDTTTNADNGSGGNGGSGGGGDNSPAPKKVKCNNGVGNGPDCPPPGHDKNDDGEADTSKGDNDDDHNNRPCGDPGNPCNHQSSALALFVVCAYRTVRKGLSRRVKLFEMASISAEECEASCLRVGWQGIVVLSADVARKQGIQ